MSRSKETGARVLVGVLGVALVLFGLWLSLISLIVGIVPVSPNPYVASGDPCCSYPDTWEETRAGALFGWLWLGVALIQFVTGALLVVGTIRGHPLRWRWLPIGVAAGMAIAAAAIVHTYLGLHEAPQVTRCRNARERIVPYRSVSRAEREELAALIGECRLLAGWSRGQVLFILGNPVRTSYPDHPPIVEQWHYGRELPTVDFAQYPGAREPTVAMAGPGR